MSVDQNLYTDITCIPLNGTKPLHAATVNPFVNEDVMISNIEKSIKDIHSSVVQVGRIVSEFNSPRCRIDEVRKQYYENLYRALMNALSGASLFCSSSVMEKPNNDSVDAGSTRQDSVSSHYVNPSGLCVEDRERMENDVFWSIVYEFFPEWKEKRTSIENAQYFHHFLEKKNYDNHHRFRGKTNDIEFKRRIELFLDTVEGKGLDWEKCLRKLKRRCCDLLRYGRTTTTQKQEETKKESEAFDFLSLFGSLAQRSLAQIHSRESSSDSSCVKRNGI